MALAYWMRGDKETFVAKENGLILGNYYDMRPNLGIAFTPVRSESACTEVQPLRDIIVGFAGWNRIVDVQRA
jgi:hypothetical protein